MITTILRKGLEKAGGQTDFSIRIVFADGSSYQNHQGEPRATLVFKRRRAQWKTLVFGHVGLLESYFAEDVDVEGDLGAALAAFTDGDFSQPSPLIWVRNWWHEVRFSNRSRAQARANAEFHYALGNDFFRLWLDQPAMMYTCAHWADGIDTIEDAQKSKMEHVCRKLRLEPGDTVVDVGCGWGGFMFHAHEHHGAIPTGYNVTATQVEELRAEIARRGLNSFTVVEKDFRDVEGQFDKFASIGVLEHAGKHEMVSSIKSMADCLKPGGLGVLHYIGHVGRANTEFFIRKHIFPGGWIPSLSQTIDEMERHGLEVLDVENLRRHYALTLDAWTERFVARWEDIRKLDPERFDEPFRRKWMIYLVGCAEMFRSPNEKTHLFQITFSKGNVGYDYPMSRKHLYQSPDAGGSQAGA